MNAKIQPHPRVMMILGCIFNQSKQKMLAFLLRVALPRPVRAVVICPAVRKVGQVWQ